MTRLFSIVALGIEGLMGALAAHRQYDSLVDQVLTTAVTLLPTATVIAGWYTAQVFARADEEFSYGKPPSGTS